jgi:hypothetical protein
MTEGQVVKSVDNAHKGTNARLDALIVAQRATNVLLTKLLEMQNNPHPEEAA